MMKPARVHVSPHLDAPDAVGVISFVLGHEGQQVVGNTLVFKRSDVEEFSDQVLLVLQSLALLGFDVDDLSVELVGDGPDLIEVLTEAGYPVMEIG